MIIDGRCMRSQLRYPRVEIDHPHGDILTVVEGVENCRVTQLVLAIRYSVPSRRGPARPDNGAGRMFPMKARLRFGLPLNDPSPGTRAAMSVPPQDPAATMERSPGSQPR